MPRKKPPNPATTQARSSEQMFVTWEQGDDKGRSLALYQASSALSGSEPVVRSHASDVYRDIGGPGISIRDDFNRYDYDEFRPGSRRTTKPQEAMGAANRVYKDHGVFRNVVELMSDFASQGIGIKHPNDRIQNFYTAWAKQVCMQERSERFLNLLFRMGNVVVKRQTAKIPVKKEDEMRRTGADVDIDIREEEVKIVKREIPWKYTFLNPMSLKIVNEELSLFVGSDFQFAVDAPVKLLDKIKSPKTQKEKELVARIPEDIRKSLRAGNKLIPLSTEKVKAYYYKRDDWQSWATPMVYPILTDLDLYAKMKLADRAALDGAISCIRVWKLGNIEARIMPTAAGIARLAEMLQNNVGGGVMDLIWGPEIDLVETKTDVHRFLGEGKYGPVLSAIYAGLGIPSSLAGGSGKSNTGFTNNAISLKTLMQRLEYGRTVLMSFWEQEMKMVQKAMGFRFAPTLTFTRMSMMDEAAELALFLQLVDRDYISVESLQERFGLIPEIEDARIRREHRRRQNKLMPEKVSPYHTPDKEHDLKKAYIGTRTVTPSEVGLDLKEKKSGEKPPIEMEAKFAPKPTTQGPKGRPGQGRPKNKKDSSKRKTKRVKPRTSQGTQHFLDLFHWAENAQAAISKHVTPAFLQSLGKQTMRELTSQESDKYEKYKFYVLCNLNPEEELNEDLLKRAISKKKLTVPKPVNELLNATIAKHVEKTGKEPSLELCRRFQSGVFASWQYDTDESILAD